MSKIFYELLLIMSHHCNDDHCQEIINDWTQNSRLGNIHSQKSKNEEQVRTRFLEVVQLYKEDKMIPGGQQQPPPPQQQPQMGPQPQQGPEMFPPPMSQSQPNFTRMNNQMQQPGTNFRSDTMLPGMNMGGQPMTNGQMQMMNGGMGNPMNNNGMMGNGMMNQLNPAINPQMNELCNMINNIVQTTANQIARDAVGNMGNGMTPGMGSQMLGMPGVGGNGLLPPGMMAMLSGQGPGNGPITDPACAQNSLFNCIAALINNLAQNRNASGQNDLSSQNMQPCPVPFIICKVKPPGNACIKKRSCAPSCPPSAPPCPCSCPPPPTLCCRQTAARRCCPPPDPCGAADLLGEQNRGCRGPPILLVQSGRCQTIQVQERCDDTTGCNCGNKGNQDKKKSSPKKKGSDRKGSRKGSDSSSKSGSSRRSSSSSKSSGSGSDDDDDDDDSDK